MEGEQGGMDGFNKRISRWSNLKTEQSQLGIWGES